MVVCSKKQKQCLPEELEAGDCWIALSLAQLSGLILAGRVGKHTDELAQELVTSTEGKTDCFEWDTDGWEAYGRVLPSEVDHYISKALTQRLERTNGIVRQQTGRWHRRQNALWQGLGADRGNSQTRYQLLQLDMAAFVPGNYSRTASRVNRSTLDLE
jgi:IS1 family transposase